MRVFLDGLISDMVLTYPERCTAYLPSAVLTDEQLHSMNVSDQATFFWNQHLCIHASIITDVFSAQLIHTTVCTTCGFSKHRFDQVCDLSVEILQPSSVYDIVSLQDCLRHFTQEETLTNDNMVYCNQCAQRRETTKTCKVARFPKVLIINLKRFRFVTCTYASEKVTTEIDIPLSNFDVGMLMGCQHLSSESDAVYDLYAVCNHLGNSLENGHYTADCFVSHVGEWYKFDDQYVSLTTELDLCGKDAYILFYIKQGTNSNN
jgi:ubiquitin C-terminal hydrolase